VPWRQLRLHLPGQLRHDQVVRSRDVGLELIGWQTIEPVERHPASARQIRRRHDAGLARQDMKALRSDLERQSTTAAPGHTDDGEHPAANLEHVTVAPLHRLGRSRQGQAEAAQFGGTHQPI